MNTFGIQHRLACFLATSLVAASAHAQAPGGADPVVPANPPVRAAPAGDSVVAAPASGNVTVAPVNLGSTAGPTAAVDVAAPAPAPEKKTQWIDAWAGSSAFLTAGAASLNTLLPSSQLSTNPTVATSLSFSPRYRLSKSFQLRGRIALNYEWTESDLNTNRNEIEVGDTNVQLFYSAIKPFGVLGAKVKFQPFVGVGAPTSKASRARTLYATPSLGGQLSTSFEHVLGGELALIVVGTYSRPLYEYSTAGATDDRSFPQQCFGGGAGACGSQVSGLGNPRDIVALSLISTIEWGDWSPGLFFNATSLFPYQFTDTPQVLDGSASTGSSTRLPDRSKTRQTTYFALWLDYHLNDWLTPELGYYMARNIIADDGSYGNPFFSTVQAPTFYIAGNIQLDSLYKSITGAQAEAGVVRAKSKQQPIQFY